MNNQEVSDDEEESEKKDEDEKKKTAKNKKAVAKPGKVSPSPVGALLAPAVLQRLWYIGPGTGFSWVLVLPEKHHLYRMSL